ncbi:hypothetical protein GF382_02265, partial [Candidatus Falkowbacteria bacterium]|nr:hypothetical protein [Candidatus Falkowbacteria bacterium]
MKKKLFDVLKILFFALIIVVIWAFLEYRSGISKPVDEDGQAKVFTVEPGDGVKKIAADLAAEGLIRSGFYFEAYIRNNDLAQRLQAGSYELSPAMNIKQIAEVMSEGRVVKNERQIKIIEGWNNKQIAEYLEKEGLFSKEEFLAAVRDKSRYIKDYDFLAEIPESYDMEGYLFPDTYSIYRDASVDDVIRKMLDNFDRQVGV